MEKELCKMNSWFIFFLCSLSPPWPTQHRKIANLCVFWELLMLKQAFVVLEEQRVSGGVVMLV